MEKWVYSFQEARANPDTVFLLGNKGAQLAEMTAIGLPVPPGFTINTKACNHFSQNDRQWPEGLKEEVKEHIQKLEQATGKKFGGKENPLLVSVRSGSYVSMPGMMDSILNLGLNKETVQALVKQTGNERASLDCFRRFMQMFGEVVLNVKHEAFEKLLSAKKEKAGVKFDFELGVEHLKELIEDFESLVKEKTGKAFPENVEAQLRLAIDAVFNSWNNPRAVSYRRIHRLRQDAGTAVNVQAMVFGNLGEDSATGVAFTRNPATGEKEYYGEFLVNAQGEDVVAGIRTPKMIEELKNILPEAYQELLAVYSTLENHYKDLQDFEFTIEKGKLFLLQTRAGKRTAQAAVKIAVDMAREGLISQEEALLRVKPEQLDQLLHKQFDQKALAEATVLAKGLPASPGAAVGQVYFDSKKAAEVKEQNPEAKIILVRTETSPEDIEGMHAAQGILTSRGGMTSHAAVVARGMGKCAVVGCESLSVNESAGLLKTAGGEVLKEGEWLSLDGGAGQVLEGKIAVIDPELSREFHELMQWADQARRMQVRTNADTPKDSILGLEFGAQGIGLARTEHMFFEAGRINIMREMILAKDKEAREKALAKLLPIQKEDFKGIFKAMDGLPVTIRLLDPPLHEFLPKEGKDIKRLSQEMQVCEEDIRKKAENLHEFNPMLGHRGCRLGITFPEIYEMQVKAIFKAALEAQAEGLKPLPEIEIPLIGHVKEFKILKEMVLRQAKECQAEKIDFKVGTMIELPRACLTADEIAAEADFLSFGTNDLTQTTFGFSRDDASKFIPEYMEKKVLPGNPFQKIDRRGVGKLMKWCVQEARKSNPRIEVGICGEHGGEASSVEFCHEIGLDYVSCSPYRVPLARLAAAQAVLKKKK